MKNIVKQINQQAAHTDFKSFWMSITVTEVYHYLGCLIYMEVQPLCELEDHWHLKTSVASCLSQKHFKQIQHAFTIQNLYTSSKQSGDSWWFRVEPLTTIICKACQKYWTSETHLAVDECMMLYFEHIWHAIKALHKSIKQDYKIWTLENLDYIFN